MIHRIKKIYPIHWLLSCLLIVSACIPGQGISNIGISATTAIPNAKRKTTPQLSPAQRKANMEALRARQTNTSIQLMLDTGLKKDNPTSETQQLDLTDLVGGSSALRIQSAPSGPVVFSETFTKGRKELEEVRTIRISDTSKRYTLHVKKNGDSRLDGQVTVNMNGTNWIKEQDFQRNTREAENNTLLLNANNSLRVRLTGKVGSSVTVSLVEGGEAGTILRRRGNLRKPGETQATHIRRNDTNIFDPNDSTSLGQLEAFGGGFGSTETNSAKVTTVSINGESFQMETNTLLMVFENPSTDLNLFLDRYDAKVLDTIDLQSELGETWYYLQINPDSLPLEESGEILKFFRLSTGDYAKEFAFSSVSGLKTFLILLDFFQRYPDKVKNFDLNYISKLPSETKAIEVSDYYYDPLTPNIGWWMEMPEVNKAWNYSLGTGVKIAYFDGGYQGLSGDTYLPNRRIMYDPYNNFEHLPNTPGASNLLATRYQSENHAVLSMYRGFSEFDDGLPQIGSGPNVTLIPYNGAVSYFDSLRAMAGILTRISGVFGGASQFKPDIIHFNQNFIVEKSLLRLQEFAYFGSTNDKSYSETMTAFNGLVGLISNIVKIYQVPVVVPAHNDGRAICQFPVSQSHPCEVRAPASVYNVPLIIVGSLNYISGEPLISRGSNHGANFIWSPHETNHAKLKARQRTLQGQAPKDYDLLQGTSGAGPYLTGVVALMKSRNPNLTPQQIKDILFSTSIKIKNQQTEDTLREKYAHLQPTPLLWDDYNQNGLRMFNARAAVEKAIELKERVSNPSQPIDQILQKYLPKEYLGLIKKEGEQLFLIQNDGAKRPIMIGSNGQLTYLEHDKVSRVKAWTGIHAGQNNLNSTLEVLKAANHKVPPVFDPPYQEPVDHVTPPQITELSLPGIGISSGQSFTLEIEGENLVGFSKANTTELTLITDFIELGTAPPRKITLPAKTLSTNLNPIQREKFLAGRYVKLEISQSNTASLESGKSYYLSVTGPNGTSLNSNSFSVQSTSGGNGTFQVKTVLPTAAELPQNQYLYDQVGNRWMRPGFRIQVDANEFAGIRFTQPIRDLEVKIGPVLVPITSILQDLAVVGIPDNLPAGVHDVVVKASGQTLTLEQAVEKVSQAMPPTPEPSAPPSGNPGQYRGVRVFNLEGNDEGRVYLNDQLILSARAGEDNYANLGDYNGGIPLRKDQRNEFRFEVINNGGGYTYGFEVQAGNGAVYQDIQGTPEQKNKVWSDGSEDQRQGVVYNERFITHSNFTPVGSGPFWVKIFNLNPDESLTVSTYNETNDIQWPDGSFRVASPVSSQEVSKQLPLAVFNPITACGTPDPNFECWDPRYISFYFENPEGTYNAGIEVYKGINLVYRNILGQRGVWGAWNNLDTSSQPYLQDYVAHQYRHYPAGY